MRSKTSKNNTDQEYKPPRGRKCINWLPIIKAKLMERTEISTKQRLFASTLAINSAISFTYTTFNLSPNNMISFCLNTNDIIHGLIDSFNETVLFKWDGIQDRNNILETISWNKYLNKSNNYIDQYKNTFSHKLFIPMFDKCIQHINELSFNQYTYNNKLKQLFQSCLIYSSIYSLLISEVGFHQSAVKPIIINTALVKNGKIRSYLKQFDPQISIFEWKEHEDETTHIQESKICERVRVKCIKYIENALINAYQQFYTAIGGLTQINNINFNQFKISVKFNKQKHAVKYPKFDPTPNISSKYFNTDFYCKQISKKQPLQLSNNNRKRSQRQFQLVNNYGISSINTIENRSNIRKYNVETNINQRRNDMNIGRDECNYGGLSLNEVEKRLIHELQMENEALKREKQLLIHELQMEENNDNMSYNVSINSYSNASIIMGNENENENEIVGDSVSFSPYIPFYFEDYNEMI